MLCRLTRGGSDYKVCYVDLPGRGWAIKYAMSTNMERKCAIKYAMSTNKGRK